MRKTKPYLKWVGGKSQLLKALSKLITHKSLTYYEPFLGGGAVFFHFADRKRFRSAVLNDFNPELTNTYEMVRDRLPELLVWLDALQADPEWNTEAFFKGMRVSEPTDPVQRAARMIYLNKTAFNGLWRVNKQGKYNAPFGKYNNPTLYNRHAIEACSEALQAYATIHTGNYFEAVKDAKAGDLVYFDPPYVPVSDTANFTAYAGDFGQEQQRELAALFRELYERGVFVVQSNSDAPLLHELYEGFEINIVGAKRSINSKGDGRGEVNEVVIVGKPSDLKIDVPADTYLPDVFPLECADCGTIYSSSDIVCIQCGSSSTK